MKFRDPKTGETYEHIIGVWVSYCRSRGCMDCPISKAPAKRGWDTCKVWVCSNPAEAARLMGYEIIEEEAMEESRKPRLCEVLGVEPDEEFRYPGMDDLFRIHGGIRERKIDVGRWIGTGHEAELTKIINHPERIIRKPRWTEEDIEDARAIIMVTGMEWVARDDNEELWCFETEPTYSDTYWRSGCEDGARIPNDTLLPSLSPGEKALLSDIIGGEA